MHLPSLASQTLASETSIYPRIHCMLTCRLEAALSYTLPVDTIFTVAFTTFCKQLVLAGDPGVRWPKSMGGDYRQNRRI